MSKLKVKCAGCGKVFAPSNMKQTRCPDCEKAQRAAKAQRRAEAAVLAQVQQPSAPLIQGPGANVLRPDTMQIDTAPELASAGTNVDSPPSRAMASSAPLPEQPMEPVDHPAKKANGSGRTGVRRMILPAPRVEAPSFALTSETRQKIEERYLALANPVEFDGIRTQIAAELGIPKPAVRQVVREVRRRRSMPSWWEAQGFSGSLADLERIKAAYTPYLPLPPIGVHREIAESLGLEPRTVYRGIRKIRAQLGLPQYNALEEHPQQAAVAAMPGEQAQP
jgi:hypothetical protein